MAGGMRIELNSDLQMISYPNYMDGFESHVLASFILTSSIGSTSFEWRDFIRI
jgi:hypothetical protein